MPLNTMRLCSMEERINANPDSELFMIATRLLGEVRRLRIILSNADRIESAKTSSVSYPFVVPQVNYIVTEAIHV